MQRVKRAYPLRETDNLGPREAAEEKEAEEARFRVGGAVQSPADEIDDATATASIATQLLQQRPIRLQNQNPTHETTSSYGLGL